jgi:phage I-like protein
MTMLLASLNSRRIPAGQFETLPGEALALNAEGGAPEWVMLWPQGRLVVGRDKRSFIIHDPEAIIAATNPRLPLLVDYEHDFDHRRPGDETPAAGWIEELEVREGAIFGRVRWTDRAANAIAGLEYRFHSPVYWIRPTGDPQEVVAIAGAALTHTPNLPFTALNSEQGHTMDKELLKALGLPEDAGLTQAINAAQALATPSPGRFVPRADFDQALERATNAEARLKAIETERAERDAAALVEKAIGEGKIAPASKEHFLRLALNARQEVEQFLASAPSILKAGADDDLKRADPARPAAGALTETQKAICSAMGLSEEAFVKAAA